MFKTLAKYNKLWLAILGIAIQVASPYYGAQPWFNAIVGLLTVYGIYRVPNAQPVL